MVVSFFGIRFYFAVYVCAEFFLLNLLCVFNMAVSLLPTVRIFIYVLHICIYVWYITICVSVHKVYCYLCECAQRRTIE